MSRRLLCTAVLVTFAAASCRRAPPSQKEKTSAPASPSAQKEKEPEGHEDDHGHEALPRKVTLSAEVAKEAGVAATAVTRQSLQATVALPGEIAADPDRAARVASPVAGRIDRVLVAEGAVVKKGETVAILRVPDLGRIRGALTAAKAKGRSARAHEERLRALYEKGLTPEQTYFDARAEAEALEAEVRALSEHLASIGAGGQGGASTLALRAPLGGVVVSRDAVVGQPVSADRVLFQIAEIDEVWFLARLFEKDLARIAPGAVAEIELNAFPSRRFVGTVEVVGRQVDPTARTVTARVRVKNADGVLRFGLFGLAHVGQLDGKPRQAALVVPRDAVVDLAGRSVVFVKGEDDGYEVHDVVLGEGAAGKVEIVSGLREGEMVVARGAFTLKSLVLKGTMAHDDD